MAKKRLPKAASGARHLRWGREVEATMTAHGELNDSLTEGRRELLAKERKLLQALLAALEAAVTPYRAFLDGASLGLRAKQRVANHLCDVALTDAHSRLRPHRAELNELAAGAFARLTSGLALSRVLAFGHERTVDVTRAAADVASLVAGHFPFAGELAKNLDRAADRLDGFVTEQRETLEPQRAPLRLAVERAVLNLREGLEQMDGRLRSQFTQSFIDSLYPELDTGRGSARDEDDGDDDGDEDPTPDA